jgi:hypothetical protein
MDWETQYPVIICSRTAGGGGVAAVVVSGMAVVWFVVIGFSLEVGFGSGYGATTVELVKIVGY